MRGDYEMTGQLARAFNLGCDARLAGLPETANPYTSDGRREWYSWRAGWHDCAIWWGCYVAGRWAIMSLPLVRSLNQSAGMV